MTNFKRSISRRWLVSIIYFYISSLKIDDKLTRIHREISSSFGKVFDYTLKEHILINGFKIKIMFWIKVSTENLILKLKNVNYYSHFFF